MSGGMIIGPGFPLMEMLGGADGDNGNGRRHRSLPGDIALLAERSVERASPKSFEPGTIVQMRSETGFGVKNSGPYAVIRTLPAEIWAHDTSAEWESRSFTHASADMVVGMIVGNDHERVWREMYVWSGFLEPYPLTDTDLEMIERGKENARQTHPRQRRERDDDAEQERAVPARPKAQQKAHKSPWGE